MNARKFSIVVSVLSIVLVVGMAGAKKPPWQTTITDLGAFPVEEPYYDKSEAYAINDLGQVVGYSYVGFEIFPGIYDYTQHAFLWLPVPAYGLSVGMHDLGVLDSTVDYAESDAWDINNHTWVVGNSTAGEYDPIRGFCWSPEYGMEQLETLHNMGERANGINDFNEVVGHAWVMWTYPVREAATWRRVDDTWEISRSGCLMSTRTAINEAGISVGSQDYWNGYSYETHGRVWGLTGHDDLGQGTGVAHDINTLNQVVGDYYFWTQDDGVVELPGLEDGRPPQVGCARAINDSSIIVGEYDGYAVMWVKYGHKWSIINLNTFVRPNSGWFLSAAYDINNKKQIVGIGSHNGKTRAYLLKLGRIPDPWQPGDPGGPFGSDGSETAIIMNVYPNPFEVYTTIKFNVGHNIEITELYVCDATGRVVKSLNHPIANQIIWDGTDNVGKKVPAGIYFLQLETNGGSILEKIVRLK